MSFVYIVSEEALVYDHTPEDIWNPVGVFTSLLLATECQQRKTKTRLKIETFDLDQPDGHLVKPGFMTKAAKSRRHEDDDWIRQEPSPVEADLSESDGFVRWSVYSVFNDGAYDEVYAWAPTLERCVELREAAMVRFEAEVMTP